MTRIGEDGVPSNGRTEAQIADRAADPAAAADGWLVPRRRFTVGAAINLLALAATIILLAAGLALAGALMWPKTHAARAEVLYPITQEQPSGSALREDRSLTTQLVLLRGRAVLGPVAADQGRTVEDLQQHVNVTVLESSEIIQVEVTDRSAQRALQTAQAVVNGYLAVSQSGQPMLRQRLDAELVASNTALADAQARLGAAGTATAETVAPLQAAVQAQQSRRQQLQAQLDALNLAPMAQLLTPPYEVGVVSPRPVFAAAAGGLVGLVLAAVVIAVLARTWAGSASMRE